MSDLAHAKTDEKLEEMEKRLSAIYSRAGKEIGERWKEYLVEAQAEIDELQKAYELAKESGDAKEIRKAGKKLSKAKRDLTLMDKRFNDLTETTATQLANVNKTALAYVNGQLPEVYSVNYNALSQTVDGVGGYSFSLVDADTVKNLATTDKSLLPYKQMDEKEDIRWNVKKINAEVLQGILQGEPMDKIARRLSKVTDMNATAAIRNARTMVTSAENKGRQDSYSRATADGIILQKEWISTNDSRTRHSHSALDGATVDQDKKFDNGLMYPGDPNGRPEEVYNCRCTVAAVVKGFEKAKVQKAMANRFEQKYGFALPENTPQEVQDDLSKGLDWSVANIPGFKTGKNGAITGVKYHSDSYESALAFMRTSETVLSLNRERIADYISHDLIVHEMVHARINRLKLTLDDRESLMKGVQRRAFEKLGLKANKKNISKYVTDYAVTDAEECVADAIAIISRRGERANDVCKSIFEELKKVIE